MKKKTDKREALLDSSVVKGKWCVCVCVLLLKFGHEGGRKEGRKELRN